MDIFIAFPYVPLNTYEYKQITSKEIFNDLCETYVYNNNYISEYMMNMPKNKNKKCLIENCYTCPSFTYCTSKTALYCKKHKLDGMIDPRVRYIRNCRFINCNIIASFNHFGSPARWCALHKSSDMININHKKCIEPDCAKLAHYKFINTKTKCPIYCKTHKKSNMIAFKKNKKK